MPKIPIYFQRDFTPAAMPPIDPSTSTSTSAAGREDTSPTAPSRPQPALRLQVNDLRNAECNLFTSTVDPLTVLREAIDAVLTHLYPSLTPLWKPVRSITLILTPGDGVADTRGLEIDDAHKEIRFYMNYVKYVQQSSPERLKEEIEGVVVHEMVHCWQRDGDGTAPVGLTEGVADWVRLRADRAPPHWKLDLSGSWCDGYQHTAYFLDWLETDETVGGKGSVRKLNEKLKDRYEEETFWKDLFGCSVDELWAKYKASFSRRDATQNDAEAIATNAVATRSASANAPSEVDDDRSIDVN